MNRDHPPLTLSKKAIVQIEVKLKNQHQAMRGDTFNNKTTPDGLPYHAMEHIMKDLRTMQAVPIMDFINFDKNSLTQIYKTLHKLLLVELANTPDTIIYIERVFFATSVYFILSEIKGLNPIQIQTIFPKILAKIKNYCQNQLNGKVDFQLIFEKKYLNTVMERDANSMTYGNKEDWRLQDFLLQELSKGGVFENTEELCDFYTEIISLSQSVTQ
ncbi:MAG: hypothetical protein H7230_01785 [Candidatus Parcubacteria bacterium]|nr:hypothetical protein [Candidatus Paceibacterota bacterium]